jgi:Flp pilus assembly protein protease CpaA
MPERGTFFPDPVFGWLFYVILVSITLAACYYDWRELRIPKPIPLALLALGLVFNVVRGAWLGAQERPVWLFAEPGAWLGAIDALLFSLAGFAIGFGLFFVLWLLKTCGGGDVKLYSALAAWVGPLWTLYVLIGSYVVVLIAYYVFYFSYKLITKGFRATKKQKLAYSFPIAISVMVVLLWLFRKELL